VAATGGVIGISIHGFLNWSGQPNQPPSLENFTRHVAYVADLVGVEHVGIGTDFACVQDTAEVNRILELSKAYPGAAGVFINSFGNKLERRYPAETPSPRQLPAIVAALEIKSCCATVVDAIAGGNFLPAFRQALVWAPPCATRNC